MNRRNLLQGLGASLLGTQLLNNLIYQIAAGFVQQAQAEELSSSGDSRYLVSLWVGGGPMRYTFDQWIKTRSTESISNNLYVNTAFKSSGGVAKELDYRTFNYNGMLVPHMFSTNVFDGKGTSRPVRDILDNMLVVRGFGTSFDGHDTNSLLVKTPVAGLPTMDGVLADANSKLFSAVTNAEFNSVAGKAATRFGGNYLKDLFRSFERSPANQTSLNLKEKYARSYEVGLNSIKTYARSGRLGSKVLSQNLQNISDRMKKGLSELDGYWNPALTRYSNAVGKTVTQIGVPGVSDVPIVRGQWGMDENLFLLFGVPNDGIGTQRNYMPASDWDMREMVQTMNMGNLAEQFAMAEYLIAGDYTPSVSLSVANFNNISLKTSPTSTGPQTEITANNFYNTKNTLAFGHTDMDGYTGSVTSTLLTHNFYSSILAGILELRDQLAQTKRNGQSVDLWKETGVQISSEFCRNAAAQGFGSGHGYQQMTSSLISGAIQKGPYLVGNILKNNPGEGTNGRMAAVGKNYLVKTPPSPATMNATIASVLRVPTNPWQNSAPSLINYNESTGIIVYPYGQGEIVEG